MDMQDFGKLVLRLTVGLLLFAHGLHKALDGIAPIKAMLAAHGIPDVLANGVYFGEIVGPVLIVLGLFTRLGGALIVINMIVAVLLAGLPYILKANPMGGYALELEMFFLFGGLCVALLGAGRFSLGGANGRFN
ncbi:MAG TPA: DoxX family protein [Rhizomicrobium sp.]|nr:DoxX family protein [Rhizomicrobium sp.]